MYDIRFQPGSELWTIEFVALVLLVLVVVSRELIKIKEVATDKWAPLMISGSAGVRVVALLSCILGRVIAI